MLTENVIEVEKHVQAACDRAGRSRDEVTLIAVSKTKPVSDIEEVLTTGILDYGENKVQELSDKYLSLIHICFKAGDKMTLKTLLYCMLIYSGNDAANAVASAVSGGCLLYTSWILLRIVA